MTRRQTAAIALVVLGGGFIGWAASSVATGLVAAGLVGLAAALLLHPRSSPYVLRLQMPWRLPWRYKRRPASASEMDTGVCDSCDGSGVVWVGGGPRGGGPQTCWRCEGTGRAPT